MLHLTLVLEDMVLTATERCGNWHIQCVNSATGDRHEASWSHEQLSAVVLFAISDSGPAREYDIAFNATKNFPAECNPMP